MNLTLLQRGLDGEKEDVDKLKQVLTDNGFKHTQSAAEIMLTQMKDLGLDNETALYWQTVSLSL